MKLKTLLVIIIAAMAVLPLAAATTVQGLDVDVEFFAPNIARVHKAPAGAAASAPLQSLSVIAEPQPGLAQKAIVGNTTVWTTPAMRVVLDNTTGGICFYDSAGRLLVRDKDYGTQFTPIDDAGRPSYSVRQAFLLEPGEAIFGLGQNQKGLVSQRNQKHLLRNLNTNICIPFFLSAKGYGLYWDNPSPTLFTDNRQETSFDSEVGDAADYYVISGGDADGVVAGVRLLTGQAPMYPLWTLGFWQCRERYKSPDELCEVLDKYRAHGVPLDGIVQDWQYWGCDSNWNSMHFDNPRFNDAEARIKSPRQMVDYVHANNAHLMISVWASFGPWTKMYERMDSLGALLDFDTWPPSSGVKPYDPFNPAARDIYWDEMKKSIFDLGIDAWWLDSTEPDHLNIKDEDFNTPTYLGSFRRVHNAFPLMTNKGVYEHQRALTDSKRVFLLTRSSSFGQQHYGSHSWSGDVASSWEALRQQIAGGLNYSLCGIPYWGTDLGGFFAWTYGDNIDNPAYHELHTRWYQWGAFQPIMRSHNSSPVAVEIYQFGEPGSWEFDTLKKYTVLRYRLLPYIYSTAWQVTSNSDSFIRPLVMDFAADSAAVAQGEEYMFGRAFLVHPVTHAQYTENLGQGQGRFFGFDSIGSQHVYLPAGARWYDFWTNELLDGGQTVERSTPIDIMPVYVRAGSIVPWGPDVQYSTEKKWDNLEIRVYPGADADFTLYEDENDNYNYEKGIYSTITFHWNDADRTLTISDRQGAYPGMLKSRAFKVALMTPGNSPADQPSPKTKTVRYTGTAKTLKL